MLRLRLGTVLGLGLGIVLGLGLGVVLGLGLGGCVEFSVYLIWVRAGYKC